jgi:hypothetical protein
VSGGAVSPYLQHPPAGQANRWLFAASAFCVISGLLILFQTQGAGDGTWILYAELLRQGHHLYADMHLALQPLFVLETSAWMAIAGNGWFISRVPAVLHLTAYVAALAWLVQQIDFTDRQRAAVLLSGFFASISFEAYRFDDYHVLADCFQLYSILALLHVHREHRTRAILLLSALLGLFSGLAITCRVNDGMALFVGALVSLIYLARTHRFAAGLLFCGTAALAVAGVVALTGDSLRDYAAYSIFRAAGSKGGPGSVLGYALKLPLNAISWLWSHSADGVLLFLVLTALAWGALIAPLAGTNARRQKLLALLGLLFVVVFARHTLSLLVDVRVLLNVSGVVVVLSSVFILWTAARLLVGALRDERFGAWDRRQVLLLIPLGQLVSGSMSSGGSHLSLYLPLVVLLLVFAVAPPFMLRPVWLRDSVTAVFALLLISTAVIRIVDPYSWITYGEHPLFSGRTIYHHPLYGRMIIDRDLLAMIQPVCERVDMEPGKKEMLSLPYSYANYFCGMPPWKSYVQTFFDTTSAATIDQLMQQLHSSPPDWIFYQRQLNSLALNERMYNHGKPLEQRKLDAMIQQRIATGAWRVVYTSDYGDGRRWDNHWFLIRTH